jgi:hypothetical protein
LRLYRKELADNSRQLSRDDQRDRIKRIAKATNVKMRTVKRWISDDRKKAGSSKLDT